MLHGALADYAIPKILMRKKNRRPRVWVVVCKGSKPREFRKWANAYRAVAVRHQKDLDKDAAPCGPHTVSRLTSEKDR